MLPKTFLPQLPGFRVEQVRFTQAQITVVAAAVSATASCSWCGQPARRMHSRHTRRLSDLPWSGKVVRLELHLRRFFCDHEACPRRTFAEQVPSLARAHAQRTLRCAEILRLLAMAMGGEAGARIVDRLSMRASSDTLLRLIRQRPPPVPLTPPVTPRVLGVDDWALRKGRTYGTILVDLERHCPIDLLPERSAAALATWLQAHPGVEIISRDRCGLYAEGATQGAPSALQVADRWHLMQNLREALERVLERHRACLQAFAVLVPPRDERDEVSRQVRRNRRHARYDQVLALAAQGVSRRAIARQLGISRITVGRYINAGSFPEIARRQQRPSMLQAYIPYLEEQWVAGRENGMQLWRELKTQGYPGSYKLVAVWATRRRQVKKYQTEHGSHRQVASTLQPGLNPDAAGASRGRLDVKASPGLPGVMRPCSARQIVWLLLRSPEELSVEEQRQLTLLCQASCEVAVAYQLGQRFLHMVRERQAEALAPWLEAAQQSGLADLGSFASGLRRDFAAVQAALTVEWSNGQTEGQVNRLKLIKRQMYGRANFDLLRLRVLAT